MKGVCRSRSIIQKAFNRGRGVACYSVAASTNTNSSHHETIPKPKEDVNWDELSFALTPTDRIYVANTTQGKFTTGELKPWESIQLTPGAAVLSYGQGIFEGIKAFRTAKDRIVIFRPQENHKRMTIGAGRFLMTPVPEDLFLGALASIVKANAGWVPPVGKGALYMRPILFGSSDWLGVAPSPEYIFAIYASPVGNYFKKGLTPINLKVDPSVHRSATRGCGDVKAIGNYAPCFLSQQTAKKEGFNEVLYVDAKEEKYVEEAGAANVFCIDKNKHLWTPSLRGTILPGVTRKSIIHLAKEKGYQVTEDKVPLTSFCESIEAFATGTGASITPIGSVTVEGKKHTIGEPGVVGSITKELYKSLTDIQMERVDDTRGWLFDPFTYKPTSEVSKTKK